MALIVEDGSGLTNADSYISRADANTYVSSFMTSARKTAWNKLGGADKDLALRMGTQFLDSQFNRRWLGTRDREFQALAWPRFNVEDYDGYVIDTGTIPVNVKRAAVEMAVRATESDIFPDFDRSASIKRESVQVGPLKEMIEYVAGDQQKDYRKVSQLLRQLVRARAIVDIERR